jgi:anti-sigma factor RsiW
MTMTCRKVAELLIDFADGTLAAEQRTVLERHLCGCVPCAIYMHTYHDTIRLTQALPDEPLPQEFAARLKSMLDKPGPAGGAATV